jgi:hypothetical protein
MFMAKGQEKTHGWNQYFHQVVMKNLMLEFPRSLRGFPHREGIENPGDVFPWDKG